MRKVKSEIAVLREQLQTVRAEDELRVRRAAAERDRLRAVFDRLEQGVIEVDGDLRVLMANRPAGRLFGKRVVIGGPLPEPWPKEAELRPLVSSAFASGETVEAEFPLDSGRLVAVSVMPASSPGEGAIIVVTDRSERERLARVERQFVANASHELRTPLATVSGAIEILQAGAKEMPEARDRFLRHIEREVGRLTRLVNALLAIARAQAKHELPPLAPVLVRPVLDDAARNLEPAPDVELVVTCASDLAAVADPDLLFEVISNLGANAAKHTEHGRIVFSAKAEDGAVTIAVSDTGTGIDLADQERLFGRFYRGGQRRSGGFGLGLSIVHEAMSALGGGVDIESAPGRGTVVRITLPEAA